MTPNSITLPLAWQRAFEHDREAGRRPLPGPSPERRLARLLAAFIASGLFFLVFPGTLIGVWNLVGISAQRDSNSVSAVWIQAHGHAQLFGWVVTFIIGISLYTVPKFRGSLPRSIELGWAMWGMWTLAVGARWLTAVWAWQWEAVWPVSAGLELAVAVLLLWQCTPSGPSYKAGEAWEVLVFSAYGGLILTLSWQLAIVFRALPEPALPAAEDRILISLALWTFCLPLVLGFSAKFFPGLLMSPRPGGRAAWAAVGSVLVAAAGYAAGQILWAAAATLAAVLAGVRAVRVFHRPLARPKTTGVDPLYPVFVRLAYIALIVSAGLGFLVARPGMLGASRHAFTVGFLAMLIFSIGPRILPAFLNSRELWSARLMRVSLVLLAVGCTLRVVSEPLAYSGTVAAAWRVLPVSALTELTAVVAFGVNLAATLATPIPVWFGPAQVTAAMPLYRWTASYPAARQVLVGAGLKTLAAADAVPQSLTLAEAAAADGADLDRVLTALSGFVRARQARSLRHPASP